MLSQLKGAPPHVQSLMEAVDRGEDGETLSVLADALEELGLPVGVLRDERVQNQTVGPTRAFQGKTARLRWAWVRSDSWGTGCYVRPKVFERLEGGEEVTEPHIMATRAYEGRAEALVDLALATGGPT